LKCSDEASGEDGHTALIFLVTMSSRTPNVVDPAARGEEIIIAKAGQQVARLVPYEAQSVVRRPGAMRGKIRIKKNFDEPLPTELLAWFAESRKVRLL
jgi:antitoxin (DNA-binding transcriptional repressor) of toxin-antitoxin stability system